MTGLRYLYLLQNSFKERQLEKVMATLKSSHCVFTLLELDLNGNRLNADVGFNLAHFLDAAIKLEKLEMYQQFGRQRIRIYYKAAV